MLPEEKELARLEAEQAELKERVTSAELETGTPLQEVSGDLLAEEADAAAQTGSASSTRRAKATRLL